MEISRKKFVLTIALVAIVAFVNGYAIQNYLLKPHQPMRAKANVFITIQTEMGTYHLLESNKITDIGENATRYGVCGAAVDVKYISLGNSTIEQTNTKLDSEADTAGATRAAGTRSFWISGGDYAFNVTKKFTFTGTITLNATGLHWSGESKSDGNLFALASFTQTTFQNNWNLTITWSVVFNGN